MVPTKTSNADHHAIAIVPSNGTHASPSAVASGSKPTSAKSPEQQHDKEDEDLLHHAVEDAGRWAYGAVLVEVWVLNDTKSKLIRPPGGWWVDSNFQRAVLESTSVDRASAGHSLLDPTNPSSLHPVSPGVGLAGALWSEVQPSSTSLRRADDPSPQTTGRLPVVWRDLQALSNDPDQPYDKRVQLMVRCGLGLAAAVAFEIQRQQGIVIYVARRQTTNRSKLQTPSNEAYLQSAAFLIGSAFALRQPRRDAISARKSELAAALKRARTRLLALKHMGVDLATLVETTSHHQVITDDGEDHEQKSGMTKLCGHSVVQQVKDKSTSVWNKSKGANVPAPPTFTWDQTAWTFFGVLVTVLMIARTNVYLIREYGSDYSIALGPIGALVTLLFGLTAAPASQPRNIAVGQTISITIGLIVSYWDGLEVSLRQGLATSLAVAIMVKLGVTHPPAGASAILFCTGQYHWSNMAIHVSGQCDCHWCCHFGE